MALPAFWVGILYDDASLDAAWDLVKHWTAEERQQLRDAVPKQGLAAKVHGRTVFEIATEVLKFSRAGLARRKRLDADGQDETRYLDILDDRVARGTTPAQELLDKFHGAVGRLGRSDLYRRGVLGPSQRHSNSAGFKSCGSWVGSAMASPVNAVLCALVAAVFFTVVGYALARRLMPRVLAAGAAPVMGWAVFSAATLPVCTLIGFSSATIIAIAALCLAAGVVSFAAGKPAADAPPTPAVPPWGFAAAAVLALVPAAAILPKYSADGVHLADPIFDHSKIAIVDAMIRQGLPPVNPVFAGTGRLSYYYLWHFSAAELALPLRVSGWEADIGLTWFTAFASLALMMAIAVWLSKTIRCCASGRRARGGSFAARDAEPAVRQLWS